MNEKYVRGERVNFKYNELHEGNLAQTFIRIFGRAPGISIHIEDDEVIEDNSPVYFIYIFGMVWIITGFIVLFQ
ncbi:hypothetical protein [Kineothrix alysoides]|uniref:hypothetical protein n=1 Tax=Kineothrix alysoides TaxID=1469948 RepID=UPI0004DB67E9|nr:hypothetical protein [Kineothrix alysoides]